LEPDDEAAAVADAERGDTTALVGLLYRRGLPGVAGLIARSRIVRRKPVGRPPIPGGSVYAQALADAILRKRHLAIHPITEPMSVARYARERWGVDGAGLSEEVELLPHDTPSNWSAIITSAIGPAVQASTIDGGGSHQARQIAAARAAAWPSGIAADRPAEIGARLKPGGRVADRDMLLRCPLDGRREGDADGDDTG
jgi:hypothetical protein